MKWLKIPPTVFFAGAPCHEEFIIHGHDYLAAERNLVKVEILNFEIMAEPLRWDDYDEFCNELELIGDWESPKYDKEFCKDAGPYVTGFSWLKANLIGSIRNWTLPTELQWECLWQHSVKGLPAVIGAGFDEWCFDYYTEDRLQRYVRGELINSESMNGLGCPPGRKVIRGHNSDSPIRSNFVRGHGLIGNAPYSTTTFRFVRANT